MADDGYAKLRARYAAYAPEYDRRWAAYNIATLNEALEAIPRDGTAAMLDVACGTGILLERMKCERPDLEIVGVDICPEMLAKARARLGEGDDRALHVARAESLPLASDAFDLVTCTNAFHLVRKQAQALAEFRRVLRPDGMLVIVDWCTDFLSMRAFASLLRITDPQPRTLRTADGMSGFMRASGFAVERAHRFRGPRMWGLMCLVARSTRTEAHGPPEQPEVVVAAAPAVAAVPATTA